MFWASAILPRQKVATVAAHLLPKLSELSQREVLSDQMGHPVEEEQNAILSCSLAAKEVFIESAEIDSGGCGGSGLAHIMFWMTDDAETESRGPPPFLGRPCHMR